MDAQAKFALIFSWVLHLLSCFVGGLELHMLSGGPFMYMNRDETEHNKRLTGPSYERLPVGSNIIHWLQLQLFTAGVVLTIYFGMLIIKFPI